MIKRQTGAKTVQQILEEAPSLSQLKVRLALSQQCLKAVLPLIPAPMRKAVHAGPVELQDDPREDGPIQQQQCWLLLVDNTAVAAKLRQLQPIIRLRLENSGLNIHNVKIQVLPQTKHSS